MLIKLTTGSNHDELCVLSFIAISLNLKIKNVPIAYLYKHTISKGKKDY